MHIIIIHMRNINLNIRDAVNLKFISFTSIFLIMPFSEALTLLLIILITALISHKRFVIFSHIKIIICVLVFVYNFLKNLIGFCEGELYVVY